MFMVTLLGERWREYADVFTIATLDCKCNNSYAVIITISVIYCLYKTFIIYCYTCIHVQVHYV